MDSNRSPVQAKANKSAQNSTKKDLTKTQRSLLSSALAHQQKLKNRLSQPPMPFSNSRNTDQLDDIAKTFSTNGRRLTNVQSQAALHHTFQISKLKGDTDDQAMNNHFSHEKPKTPVPRQMGSPEPSFHRTFEKQLKKVTQPATLTQSKKQQALRTKRSQEKMPRPVTAMKEQREPICYQPVMRKTHATTATQLKSRQYVQSSLTSQQQSLNQLNSNFTQSSIVASEKIQKKSSKKLLTKVSSKDTFKKTSSVNQPLVQSVSSPRVTIQLGNSIATSSMLFSGTESVVSSNCHYNSKERKMCLSEKIAPKGKKKRTNAQKQPKQISITREQIILQPLTFSSQSSSQQQVNQSPSKGQVEQSFINHSISTTFKNNMTLEDACQAIQLTNTPATNIQETTDDIYTGTNQKNQMNDESSLMQTIFKRDRNSSHIFSFQLYNVNNLGVNTANEESKEVTGFFGGVAIDGTEFRPSIEGTIEKNKKIYGITTPVFQTSNRSQGSFIPSETYQIDGIKLTEEDAREELKIIDVSTRSQVAHTMIVDNQLYATDDSRTDFKDKVYHQKSLKKVRSSEGLGLNHNTQDFQFGKLKKEQQNTQSSGNLFNKLKSFILLGNKNDQSSQDRDSEKSQVQYRCNCGHSKRPYACERALKWLSSSHSQQFEYEKSKQLYDNLLKLTAPSGSETQIERDISRTFTNADSNMNNDDVQLILSRALNAFSKYDTSIGYVQGMNFIMGALLLHCSEEIAFWLFVSLIEDYEMRDIFQPKLPGLYKHSQVLQLLEMEHLGRLYNHFCEHNIQVEMYASDWIFALFSNIIPINEYHHFLEQFFIGGWSFFYKFSLSFLKSLSEDLQDCDDISEILTIIKLKHVKREGSPTYQDMDNTHSRIFHNRSDDGVSQHRSPVRNNGSIQTAMKSIFNKFVFGTEDKINSQSYQDDAIWERLVAISVQEWEDEFNEDYIVDLLSNFDQEKLIFKQSNANTPRGDTPVKVKTNRVVSQRNGSLPANSKSVIREQVQKIEILPESEFRRIEKAKGNVNIYQHERTRGSMQPRYRTHIPIEVLPKSHFSRMQKSRQSQGPQRSQLQ